MNAHEQDKKKVEDAVAQFPATFGLKAFPGDVFRVSAQSSYMSSGNVMLYTEIHKGDGWLSFAKGTVNELKGQIVALPEESPKPRVVEALRQYQDGAITYVEFVRFVWSQVTEEDVKAHNQYSEPEDIGRNAEWPFQG